MLVTVPPHSKAGAEIAIVDPQVRADTREEALAFGDATRFRDAAAREREGSVRAGVKPDFSKPLGDLGETGLFEKTARRAGGSETAEQAPGGVGVRVDGEDLVAVLARSEATAARKAARVRIIVVLHWDVPWSSLCHHHFQSFTQAHAHTRCFQKIIAVTVCFCLVCVCLLFVFCVYRSCTQRMTRWPPTKRCAQRACGTVPAPTGWR